MEWSDVSNFVGFPTSGVRHAVGLWCEVDEPPQGWAMKQCPGTPSLDVRVLTYNLFWWNLFTRHYGSGKSAGKLIARTAQSHPYDIMAFQECDSKDRILADAVSSGLPNEYETIDGGRAIAVAYRRSTWRKLSSGVADVGEDSRKQYYGKRAAMWVRLQHKDSDKTVLFVNHHGPLPVSDRGGCTGTANALNLMRLIGRTAHTNDAIILAGDFNAQPWSSRVHEMDKHLHKVFTGKAMRGVDHIYTNCAEGAVGEILGKGDGKWKSDHDAVSVTLQV